MILATYSSAASPEIRWIPLWVHFCSEWKNTVNNSLRWRESTSIIPLLLSPKMRYFNSFLIGDKKKMFSRSECSPASVAF
jgi:hypothetical protein